MKIEVHLYNAAMMRAFSDFLLATASDWDKAMSTRFRQDTPCEAPQTEPHVPVMATAPTAEDDADEALRPVRGKNAEKLAAEIVEHAAKADPVDQAWLKAQIERLPKAAQEETKAKAEAAFAARSAAEPTPAIRATPEDRQPVEEPAAEPEVVYTRKDVLQRLEAYVTRFGMAQAMEQMESLIGYQKQSQIPEDPAEFAKVCAKLDEALADD